MAESNDHSDEIVREVSESGGIRLSENDYVVGEVSEGDEVVQEIPAGDEVVREIPEGDEVVREIPEGDEVLREIPRVEQGVPEGYEVLRDVPEDDEVLRDVPEGHEVQQDVPEGDEVQQDIPEGDEVQQDVPEGDEVQQEVPEGDRVEREVPEGYEVLRDVPEGDEVVREEPEGGEVLREEPERIVILREESVSGMREITRSGGIDRTVLNDREGHTVAFHFSVMNLKDIESSGFQADFETDCDRLPISWLCEMFFKKADENDLSACITFRLQRTDLAPDPVKMTILLRILDATTAQLFGHKLEGDAIKSQELIGVNLIKKFPIVEEARYFNRKLYVFVSIKVHSCHPIPRFLPFEDLFAIIWQFLPYEDLFAIIWQFLSFQTRN